MDWRLVGDFWYFKTLHGWVYDVRMDKKNAIRDMKKSFAFGSRCVMGECMVDLRLLVTWCSKLFTVGVRGAHGREVFDSRYEKEFCGWQLMCGG